MLGWFRIEPYGLYRLALLEILKVSAKKKKMVLRERNNFDFIDFRQLKLQG